MAVRVCLVTNIELIVVVEIQIQLPPIEITLLERRFFRHLCPISSGCQSFVKVARKVSLA